MKNTIPATAILLAFAIDAAAEDRRGLSVVSHLGFSQLADQTAVLSNLDAGNGGADVQIDAGFNAGLSLRYHFDSPFSSEFGWEYRSNDSVIVDAAGEALPSGNYASNIFYFNGRYDVSIATGNWQPWLGAGLSIVQEVDIDSESAAGELSFSDGGSIGYQLIAGIDLELAGPWYLTTELRYSDQRDLRLEQEGGGGGVVSGIDYQPFTVQVGIGYRF